MPPRQRPTMDPTPDAHADFGQERPAGLSPMESAQPRAAASSPLVSPTPVHPVQFLPLGSEPGRADGEPGRGIDLLLDVQLGVQVQLGRSSMAVRDVLALRNGSVIELDKLASEPVDVLVNGTLVAYGEVVVVDSKFGVRITEVVSKARRLASVA